MLIDITVPLKENTKVYPGDPEFKINRIFTVEKDGFNLCSLSLGTHTGTHIDAPLHFFNTKESIADLELKYLITNALVADVSGLNSIDEKFISGLNLEGINSILFKTNGKDIYLTESGAKYITSNGILITATESLDIEDETNNDFTVHKTLLSNNVLIVENIDLSRIKPGNYKFYCFPLKIENADGSPVRAVLEL